MYFLQIKNYHILRNALLFYRSKNIEERTWNCERIKFFIFPLLKIKVKIDFLITFCCGVLKKLSVIVSIPYSYNNIAS